MKISKLIVFVILCTFPFFFSERAFAYPTVKATAKVLDENGGVIEGADVYISFEIPKEDGLGLDNIGIEGVTNVDGIVTGQANGTSRIGITVRKEGYYFSRQIYEFISRSKTLNRWEPWNPTIEVVLKKKRNPVPMYVKGTNWIEVPKLDVSVGYDLEKGDWVVPYGTGLTSDLSVEFNLIRKTYTDYDANLIVSFPDELDGIQPYYFDSEGQSSFKWPFEAPVTGYQKSVNIFEHDSPTDGYRTNKKENVNYIFRVRTKVDQDGKIVEALYGKISGEFGISRKGKTKFMYYFNPDGTRNLEEDPEQNLFDKK